jgi:hypothetical protein
MLSKDAPIPKVWKFGGLNQLLRCHCNHFTSCPGGVAQGTLHPLQGQEDPGSNPARV